MSYKKFGRLHFVRFGRFGFSFFISRKRKQLTPAQQQRALSRAPRCRLKKMLSWSSDSRKKSEKRRMNISARCGLFIEPPERAFHRRSPKVSRTAEARPAIEFWPPAESIPIGKRVV